MYCGKCGVRADDRDMFCAECGSSLKIKKKKFVRNTIVSGKGLLTDYSGVVVKISVILMFLVVTGNWIFMGRTGRECVGNSSKHTCKCREYTVAAGLKKRKKRL